MMYIMKQVHSLQPTHDWNVRPWIWGSFIFCGVVCYWHHTRFLRPSQLWNHYIQAIERFSSPSNRVMHLTHGPTLSSSWSNMHLQIKLKILRWLSQLVHVTIQSYAMLFNYLMWMQYSTMQCHICSIMFEQPIELSLCHYGNFSDDTSDE